MNSTERKSERGGGGGEKMSWEGVVPAYFALIR